MFASNMEEVLHKMLLQKRLREPVNLFSWGLPSGRKAVPQRSSASYDHLNFVNIERSIFLEANLSGKTVTAFPP
jgi:hypothetical protein